MAKALVSAKVERVGHLVRPKRVKFRRLAGRKNRQNLK